MLLVRFGVAIISTVLAAVIPLNVPTFQRPIPGQEIAVGGEVFFIKASVNDQPFKSEDEMLVPTGALAYVAVVSAIGTLALAPSGHRLATAATWITAMTLTDMITNLAKNFCGYLRPNFFGGCGWDEATRTCARDFPDGRHSFPSGHSSFSACSAVLISLSAQRASDRLRLAGGGEDAGTLTLRLLASLSYCMAFFVAFSRVYDNWHFPADIVTGACLGYGIGVVVMQMGVPLMPVFAQPDAGADDQRSTVPLLVTAGSHVVAPMI